MTYYRVMVKLAGRKRFRKYAGYWNKFQAINMREHLIQDFGYECKIIEEQCQ